MKLHLPSLLRYALLASLGLTSFSATVCAEEETDTTGSIYSIKRQGTGSDSASTHLLAYAAGTDGSSTVEIDKLTATDTVKLTADITGWLSITTNANKNQNAIFNLGDFDLTINNSNGGNASNATQTTFTNAFIGSDNAAFTYTGSPSYQSYVFAGEMSAYKGSIAINGNNDTNGATHKLTFTNAPAAGTTNSCTLNASSVSTKGTLRFTSAYTVNSVVNAKYLEVSADTSFSKDVSVSAGMSVASGATASITGGTLSATLTGGRVQVIGGSFSGTVQDGTVQVQSGTLSATLTGGLAQIKGGSFSGTVQDGTVQMQGGTLGSFTLGGGTLDLGTVAVNTTDEGTVTTVSTIAGTENITLTSGKLLLHGVDSLTTGDYTLLSTTGTLSWDRTSLVFNGHYLESVGDTGVFYYGEGSNRHIGTLSISGGNTLTLNIAAFSGNSLNWVSGSGTWSDKAGGWNNGENAANFSGHDVVTFGSTSGSDPETITISGLVTPSEMTVVSGGNYIFNAEDANSGLGGAGSLIVNGSAVVNGTHSSWTGSTEITDGGTLSLVVGSSLLNHITVNEGGTLNMTVSDSRVDTTFTPGGAGTVNIILTSGTTWTIAQSSITSADEAITQSGSSFTGDIVVSGGGTLKLGDATNSTGTNFSASHLVLGTAGTLTLKGANTTLDLDTTQNGTWEFSKNIVLGNGTKITIPDGHFTLKSIQLEENATASIEYNFDKTLTIKSLTSIPDKESNLPTGSLTITHGNNKSGQLKITDSLSIGTLTLENTNSTATISANNINIGTLNASKGTLNIDGSGTIGTLTVNSTTNVNNANLRIGTVNVNSGSAVLQNKNITSLTAGTGTTTTLKNSTVQITTLNVSGTVIADFTGSGDNNNLRTLTIHDGGHFVIKQNGTHIKSSDITIHGGGRLTSHSIWSLGNSAGTINIEAEDKNAIISAGYVQNNGTENSFRIDSAVTGKGTLEFQSCDNAPDNHTAGNHSHNGPISVEGVISDGAKGTLAIKQTSGTVHMSNSGNSYSGGTTITGGKMVVVANNALGNANGAVVVSDTGVLAISNHKTNSHTARPEVYGGEAHTLANTIELGEAMSIKGKDGNSVSYKDVIMSATGINAPTSSTTIDGVPATTQHVGEITGADISVMGEYSISNVTLTDVSFTATEAANLTNTNVTLAGINTLTLDGGYSLSNGIMSTNVLSGMALTGSITINFSSALLGHVEQNLGTNTLTISLGTVALPDTLAYTLTGAPIQVSDNLTAAFGDASLVKDDSSGIISITFAGKETDAVPEPTTATLSLLALAGLAARRRRK